MFSGAAVPVCSDRLKEHYHEKNHSSTFNLNQRLFTGKPPRLAGQFLDIFSFSRDTHLLKCTN